MEKTSALIANIYNDAGKFISLQTKAIKFEVYERVTAIISNSISTGLMLLAGIFAFLFLNIGLAFWVSDLTESFRTGFLIVGGFYTLVLGIVILARNKIPGKKMKNSILLKVSKTMNDYDQLLQEQSTLKEELALSEASLKQNFEELKENITTFTDGLTKLKRTFVGGRDEETNTNVGGKIPRIAITGILDFVLSKVVFGKLGLVKRTLLPIITNALVTSTIFKESKKTSLIENLKLKFSKFL